MARLPPTPRTIKKLFSLSGNQCAFPGCPQQIVDEDNNLVVSICHIEAAEEKGQRFNPKQSDEDRRSFENLLLLCPNHHQVTNNVSKYPVEKLQEIKHAHEQKYRDTPLRLTDDLLDKMLAQSVNLSISNYQNTGDGTQIISHGLSYTEGKQLFSDLLKNNIPNFQAMVAEEAGRRVKEFFDQFFTLATNRLTQEDIHAFQNPDLQFVLLGTLETAARRDSYILREELSHLLIKRIQAESIEVRSTIFNEAISTARKLTSNQLKILTLHYLLSEQIFLMEPKSWGDLQSYYECHVRPFIDFENRYADFRFIDYCGCCSIDTSFGPTSYAQILKNRLPFFFPLLGKEVNEQHYIEAEISRNLTLGRALIDMWKATNIWAIDLTIIGIVIASSFYDVCTGASEFITLNEYFTNIS